jgi:hypothetical protein
MTRKRLGGQRTQRLDTCINPFHGQAGMGQIIRSVDR